MKNKAVMYTRVSRDVSGPGEPTLQDQLSQMFKRFERREMSRRIKAGITRKKMYEYNSGKAHKPNIIKKRN